MRLESIKSWLQPYTLVGKRKTTLNHSFASAIAAVDPYNREKLTNALTILGQSDMTRLLCVYCDQDAQTWDHLMGLVRDSKYAGYGHTIGNLVPSCKNCNSKKSNGDWRVFAGSKEGGPERVARIERYQSLYNGPVIDEDAMESLYPDDIGELARLRSEIYALYAQADVVAKRIRDRAINARNSQVSR